MHAPLVAAMTAFEKASEDFSAKLEAENAALRQHHDR